jgi:hypothetical protein
MSHSLAYALLRKNGVELGNAISSAPYSDIGRDASAGRGQERATGKGWRELARGLRTIPTRAYRQPAFAFGAGGGKALSA